MDAATRARDFLRSLDELVSTRIEDLQYGTAYFNLDLPRVHDRTNFVRVSAWLDAAGLAGLIQETDNAQREAALAHRKAVFEDPRDDRVAKFLRPLGWEVRPRAVLAYAGGKPWAAPPGHRLTELTGDQARDAVEFHLRSDPKVRDPEMIRQLLEEDDRLSKKISIRWFAAYDNSRPVSICGLYSDGRTAQIEELSTVTGYRKRGHGHAVLAAALHAAAEDHDLIIGIADAGGWQQTWYERLGFQPVAQRAEALRVVGASAKRA
jgi:GNAT superfamily N-acetyltransferase